jgi:hypothetical protein
MACPSVPVSKPDGSVRICGDYSVTANKYIDPEQYILPTIEEHSTNMANCTVFSKLDLRNAYLQLPLRNIQRYPPHLDFIIILLMNVQTISQ